MFATVQEITKEMGPIIGKPTGGGVIGTVDVTLVNGHSFRIPRYGWWTNQGVDLEIYGVPPDYDVAFPYEAYRDGKDPQIEKAVQVLLEEMKTKSRLQPPKVEH